ncbi:MULTISPECIES: NAD(P)H-dependent oxidoreductase [unclassified Paenibacillus]|uniref:NAD(P)H-dependent oxidoreductase n=1 Tax=unclassified Paenibacillus TaxID=185978 RepID=UPI00278578C2|nr:MULTISPECIES: NAD(P)H-dependent oxidoreductase [unclassified Paenibacillus]MDQ0899073.1 putative NADPH-quinone reductase [Paenibacillus sp. V4I7]MDQ0914944.1 putative NADPH-quinone reductase [Paenibacillus sp. V4I5]
MKTLVIVTHPNIDASNWNKAWLEELQKHDDITIHELYKAYPDENIDVSSEQLLIEAHDRIIFQYPLYWYSTPPLLKKWFDSVLQYNWAYGPDGNKTAGKEIGVAISTYGTEESYQASGFNRFTLQEILRPIEALARFISASYLPHFALNDTSDVTAERLAQSSIDYIHHIKTVKTLVNS